MNRFLSAFLLLLLGLPAWAQTVRNDDIFSIALHDGPGTTFRVLGRLVPGEEAELGRCLDDGRWCVASTDTKWGWVEADRMTTVIARGGAVAPILPDAPIFQDTLPAPSGAQPRESTAGFETGTRQPDQFGPEIVYPVPDVRMMVPRMFSTTQPFRNVTNGLVNLRAGPGTGYEPVGQLRPGEGGRIDLCNMAESWCRLDEPGLRGAWVKMTLMGTRRLPGF